MVRDDGDGDAKEEEKDGGDGAGYLQFFLPRTQSVA
jgi:hypothetical protein